LPFRREAQRERGQSLVELSLSLPLLIVLLVGLVEVAFYARTYLVLLEASREGARVGARTTLFENSDVYDLVVQDLSREGYNTSALQDVIIVRAEVEVVGGSPSITSYTVANMMDSGLAPQLTQTAIASSMPSLPNNGEYSNEGFRGRLIGVEVYYDHEPFLGRFPLISALFPEPARLHTYSVMHVVR
jgi:hypothetical protein